MAIDREVIYQALFKRLSVIPGIVTASRKMKDWSQVPASQQPFLTLITGPQTPETRKGLPPRWKIEATCYLFARHDADPSQAPGSKINALIKAVEECLELTTTELAVLERDISITAVQFQEISRNSYGTTLDGLVSHAWIGGTIIVDEGALENQGVAVIPIEILSV